MFKSLLVVGLIYLLLVDGRALGEDLELSLFRIYGTFEGREKGGVLYLGNKEVAIKKGEVTRLEITEYNPMDGVDPALIDVVLTVFNKGPKPVTDVEMRMSIAPKVASLIFLPGLVDSGKDPSTADKDETERTAEWFAPILLLRKSVSKIPAGGSVEVVFEKVNLKSIIQKYVARRLWPTELRMDASVEAKGKEDTFVNNTVTRYFKVHLPPY